MPRLKSMPTAARHQAFHEAFVDFLKGQEKSGLAPVEILAMVSHVLGGLLALQYQTACSADEYMEIVARNIEHGNADAIEFFLGKEGGQA